MRIVPNLTSQYHLNSLKRDKILAAQGAMQKRGRRMALPLDCRASLAC